MWQVTVESYHKEKIIYHLTTKRESVEIGCLPETNKKKKITKNFFTNKTIKNQPFFVINSFNY